MATFFKWFRIIICQWLMSIGIFILLVMSLWNWMDYWRTKDWIQIEGRIIHLQISNFDGSKPDAHWPGNGNLVCEYAYALENKNYSGNKTGVETFGDSSYRSRRYRQLKTQLDAGKSIIVFVNPNAPAKSALFREILPDMCFVPAIGLIWFGGIFLSCKNKIRGVKSRAGGIGCP